MSPAGSSPIGAPPHIHALLTKLHKLSIDQEAELQKSKSKNNDGSSRFVSSTAAEPTDFDALMRDKFIALDEDKCHFVYQLIRAKGATTIVEAGTSYGVSTIYLALAAGRNAKALGKAGATVIATEFEVEKAGAARAYWKECGESVEGVVDLRVGDILETLKEGVRDVDVLLLDIWAKLALPTLTLMQPKLRPGAVVLVDNTVAAAGGYKELLEYMKAPGSGFTNIVVPYSGGFEMSVYYPPL
ncbi:S-adenosyl-L-methionine-dependent methyltransferase [Mycena maculata]|uniref:S-adenosyl-L-methionine-dependent methyltransferase n=1 Tax=Mycena maculata TaxID=230809 RepID=A0AAD7KB85_9AGAR|nr:S-adenosyl-L-methionine-dependent methyltransferase [Mycena maculata]